MRERVRTARWTTAYHVATGLTSSLVFMLVAVKLGLRTNVKGNTVFVTQKENKFVFNSFFEYTNCYCVRRSVFFHGIAEICGFVVPFSGAFFLKWSSPVR